MDFDIQFPGWATAVRSHIQLTWLCRIWPSIQSSITISLAAAVPSLNSRKVSMLGPCQRRRSYLLSTDSKTAQSARKPFTSDGRNSFHSPGLQCNITSVRPKSNDRLIHRVFLESSMIPSRKDSSLSGHSLSYGSMKTSSGPELRKWWSLPFLETTRKACSMTMLRISALLDDNTGKSSCHYYAYSNSALPL
jgi:hypothetical protein